MAPGKRRTMLAREFARTRAYLLSAEWLGWAAKQPVELRNRAAILLMSLEVSRLALLDAELDSLRHKLAANEAALAAAVEALVLARDDAVPSERTLDMIADLMAIIARAVPAHPLL
ncbi:MAG TPA: hypothetical protein VLG66_18665 [Alphaproteobacteria bacterium]|nr:hypothetical protein [Alphaproteobacteria bacterium]